jgi:hypothetical protein
MFELQKIFTDGALFQADSELLIKGSTDKNSSVTAKKTIHRIVFFAASNPFVISCQKEKVDAFASTFSFWHGVRDSNPRPFGS